jgi:hypothetical protein
MTAARDQLGKHVPTATDTHVTGTVFSTWPMLRCYKQGARLKHIHKRQIHLLIREDVT